MAKVEVRMVAALGLRDHGWPILSSQTGAGGSWQRFEDSLLGVQSWSKLILFEYLVSEMLSRSDINPAHKIIIMSRSE